MTMMQFSDVFKARAVRRMVGPGAISANRLSRDVGVTQSTLSRWLREARNVEAMTKPSKPVKSKSSKPTWTGAEKLRVVRASYGLDETALGALLRREGVHEAQLVEWLKATEEALGAKAPSASRGPSPEARRNQELEREIRRKDKALAETAALLVLKKKVQAIWGDEDDITDPRNGR